jgi:hypothetical protein
MPPQYMYMRVLAADGDATIERPETLPQPSSNVPFYLDPEFVERAALTDQVRARLSLTANSAALVGLGGVG